MALPVLERPMNVPRDADGKIVLPSVTLKPGDVVRVHNLDDTDYEFMWDSVGYVVPANGDGMMPFEAMANWFGDPRSTSSIRSNTDHKGLRGWIPDRETEVRRLRMKYGVEQGDERVIREHPNVEVYTASGERVLTVLDDPSGQSTNVEVPRSAKSFEDLATQVTNLQNQIAAITRNQAAPPAEADPFEPTREVPGSDALSASGQPATDPPDGPPGDASSLPVG